MFLCIQFYFQLQTICLYIVINPSNEPQKFKLNFSLKTLMYAQIKLLLDFAKWVGCILSKEPWEIDM